MSSLECYQVPDYSRNQYIQFQNLQIVSLPEDVKVINVVGLQFSSGQLETEIPKKTHNQ
jgi:hypothetical protein